MAIQSYQIGQSESFTIPGDDENPTVFVARPITGKQMAVFSAVQARAAALKGQNSPDPNSIEATRKKAEIDHSEQIELIVSRLVRIENTLPGPKDLTTEGEFRDWLDGIGYIEHHKLLMEMTKTTRLESLKFRPDPSSRVGGETAEGERAVGGGSGSSGSVDGPGGEVSQEIQ